MIDYITLICGFISSTSLNIGFISQLIQIYRTKSSKDISYIQYILLVLEFSMWIIFYTLIGYTTINSYIPLIYNTCGMFYSIFILLLKFKYG